jgi:septal ring-binding cell division protein DamX
VSSNKQENYSHGKKRPGFLRSLFTFSWIVVCIVLIFLAAIWFYPRREAAISLLRDLKPGPKVFRQKISEDLKLAQNLIRHKVPAEDHPAQSQTPREIEPEIKKMAVRSEQEPVSQGIQKSDTETGLDRPIDEQAKIETATPVGEKTVPLQPSVETPEDRETQATALSSPPQPKTEIEALLPVEEKTISSIPEDALPEKTELPEKSELEKPMEQQTTIEMSLSEEEKAESSQPDPELAAQKVLLEETKLSKEEMQPPPSEMEDRTGITEERTIRREKWLLSKEPSHYTIQLMGVRKESLLFDFVRENNLLEKNEIAFYQTTFQDAPWFQLLYGVYETKVEALAAAENLPAKIRKSSPWVRRLSGVQRAIRRRAGQ